MPELSQALNDLLTTEECAAIDQTLLPTRDRFSIRITVYSWRYLQRASTALGIAIAELHPQQIKDWVQQDPTIGSQTNGDNQFSEWLSHLLTSSLPPLQAIAHHERTQIENLTLQQIINWFEEQVKARA